MPKMTGMIVGAAIAAPAQNGMMIAINSGAATLGTPIFGYIIDRTGSYALAWETLAVTVSIGIVGLALLLKEPKAN